MTESDRSKTIEVMARAFYESRARREMHPVAWDEKKPIIQDEWRADAEAALTAYESHLHASGMAVVPVEPTEEMSNAGSKQVDRTNRYTGDVADNVYAAMLAASPSGKAPQPMGSAEEKDDG